VAEDVVIPFRLETDYVEQQVQKLRDMVKEPGDAAAEGAEKASGAMKKMGQDTGEASAAMMSLGNAVGQFAGAQLGFLSIQGALQGIAARARDAAEYIRKISEDFIELRQTLQHVAALRGEQATSQFTVEQAQRAYAAGGMGVKPYVKFEERFRKLTGAQIGAEGKLSDQEGEYYKQEVARFMQAKGIDAAEGAELAASVLEHAEGKQSVEGLMSQVGRTWNVLQARGLQQLGPKLGQVMISGVSSTEAAQLAAMIAPSAPDRPLGAVDNIFRSIRQLKTENRAGEFGIAEGMTRYEEVRAFGANIFAREQRGQRLEQILRDAKLGLGPRESRAVQGLAEQVGMGGLQRFEAIAQATPADYAGQISKAFEESEPGRAIRRQSEIALGELREGQRLAPVEAFRERARAELTAEGRLGENAAGDWFRRVIGGMTGQNADQQLINERAFELAQAQRGVTPRGLATAPFARIFAGGEFQTLGPGATHNEANAAILEQLQKQTEHLGNQTTIMRQGQHQPLAAPPARVAAGRMGGP
jgi:hypothetical protein